MIRDLLELPQSQPVTPDDDFFDLGGDSLLALSLISRVNQRCGISMDVSDLFESAEVKLLAKRLDALRGYLGTVDNKPLKRPHERSWSPSLPPRSDSGFSANSRETNRYPTMSP